MHIHRVTSLKLSQNLNSYLNEAAMCPQSVGEQIFKNFYDLMIKAGFFKILSLFWPFFLNLHKIEKNKSPRMVQTVLNSVEK